MTSCPTCGHAVVVHSATGGCMYNGCSCGQRAEAKPTKKPVLGAPAFSLPSTLPEDALFYTLDEIAERWRCSNMTVRRLVHAGKLRAIRVGGARGLLRIPAAALVEYERKAERDAAL